ncbi:hypothetical protein [Mycobacterium aquaticum]|uniref:Uncharacterized protein n=1 Tax=Mycobacterium aquaticum TaxID=1927124 RepID=A0A1X0AH10_9MYCO|nr:hypothetical protein [Mycobacterium aquaticum]ORA29291.1 hypothetical protein BST13_27290 [Mycobacterium aquaticum]
MTTSIDRETAKSVLPLISQVSVGAWRVINGSNEVELHPQPLPPVEADQFQVAAAVMAHRYAQLAIESQIQGRDGVRIISELVDEWCGTPWPRHWPFPHLHPGPQPHPRPNEDMTAVGRMVGALVLANIGSRLASDLGTMMVDGAQRLAEASTAG